MDDLFDSGSSGLSDSFSNFNNSWGSSLSSDSDTSIGSGLSTNLHTDPETQLPWGVDNTLIKGDLIKGDPNSVVDPISIVDNSISAIDSNSLGESAGSNLDPLFSKRKFSSSEQSTQRSGSCKAVDYENVGDELEFAFIKKNLLTVGFLILFFIVVMS